MEMTREIAQDWHAKDRAAALADWCAGAIGLGEYEDAIQQADLELEWRLQHQGLRVLIGGGE